MRMKPIGFIRIFYFVLRVPAEQQTRASPRLQPLFNLFLLPILRVIITMLQLLFDHGVATLQKSSY